MPARKPDVGPLTEQFNLLDFTRHLIGDLSALRAHKISVQGARVRAELARQVLRSVALVVSAQKFLATTAPAVPAARLERSRNDG